VRLQQPWYIATETFTPRKGEKSVHARALHVQSDWRAKYPEEHHANCHVWAVLRAVSS